MLKLQARFWSLIKIIKYLAKVKLKLSTDIMSKLFSHLIAFTSLHMRCSFCFTLPSSHEFFGQIFEKIFFFLDLLVQKLFFEKSHWFQLISDQNDHLIVINLAYITLTIYQPFHHVFCWQRSFGFRWKPYCYFLPSHLTRRNFVSRSAFCLSFVFFIFRVLVYWDHYIKVSEFDSHKPSKMYKPRHPKQRTISLLGVRYTGSLLHESIACVCFLLHLSCWPEEGRVYLIDHR